MAEIIIEGSVAVVVCGWDVVSPAHAAEEAQAVLRAVALATPMAGVRQQPRELPLLPRTCFLSTVTVAVPAAALATSEDSKIPKVSHLIDRVVLRESW